MPDVLTTLRAHGDLTKIEVEDGLLRRVIPSCLDVESSVVEIDADLRAEDQSDLGWPDATGPSALLRFSALDDSALSADAITSMVAEVAVPLGVYRVESTTAGTPDVTWVGHATPGHKLVLFLRRQASAGADDLADAVDELAARSLEQFGGVIVQVHRVVTPLAPSPTLDAVVMITFPTNELFEHALTSGLPEPDPAVVEIDATQRLLVFEHRFRADPNHWGAAVAVEPNSS